MMRESFSSELANHKIVAEGADISNHASRIRATQIPKCLSADPPLYIGNIYLVIYFRHVQLFLFVI